MPSEPALELPWPQLSELIARTIGLHFPPERRQDLQRGLAGAAAELGFADAAAYAGWLLATNLTRSHLHVLASHLTVGETYFFRERKAFDALAGHILPELVRRRGQDQRLRLWSAACCTGEEAYSLAIALQEHLPNHQDWRITILATDINERYLQKAAAAVYGEWSFRDLPVTFRDRYFTRTAEGRYALRPQIRERVTFESLNLAEDSFPSLLTNADAMDVIFCRNVLMYFTPAQTRKVVANLRRVLLDGGWLVVSPSEASHHLFPGFKQVNVAGAILYQKSGQQVEQNPLCMSASIDSPQAGATAEFGLPAAWMPPTPAVMPAARAPAEMKEAAATKAGQSNPDSNTADEPQALAILARTFANQGKLQEALGCCDRWVAADPLDPTSRYLRAVVLQELGDPVQARRSLQQALYLHPDFVLAHFGLGNLARSVGNPAEANRHFANALTLLDSHAPNDPLPQSDGLTAGRLKEILTSLLALEAAS